MQQTRRTFSVVKDRNGETEVVEDGSRGIFEKVLIEGLCLKAANAFENGYLACLREMKASLEAAVNVEVNQ